MDVSDMAQARGAREIDQPQADSNYQPMAEGDVVTVSYVFLRTHEGGGWEITETTCEQYKRWCAEEELEKAEELALADDFELWRKHMAASLTEEDREWLARGGIV
jgi:hypothetical protein